LQSVASRFLAYPSGTVLFGVEPLLAAKDQSKGNQMNFLAILVTGRQGMEVAEFER
jgi:hypothetical protein